MPRDVAPSADRLLRGLALVGAVGAVVLGVRSQAEGRRHEAARAKIAAECRASWLCSERGHCDAGADLGDPPAAGWQAWAGPSGYECIAARDADCAASEDCAERGRCKAWKGLCVADDEGCARSRECAKRGSCVADGFDCGADEAHCRARPACARYGECGVEARFCRVTKPEHCAQSAECREHGRCTLGPEGGCTAATDEDCLPSEGCRERHACAAKTGFCWDDSTVCRESWWCRQYGQCELRQGECVVLSPDDCRASEGCVEMGRCTLREGVCVVGSDRDCMRATVCRTLGACAATPDKGCWTRE